MKRRQRKLQRRLRQQTRRQQKLQRSLDRHDARWWELLERERIHDLGGNRTPIQVCPRGCGHFEFARRDVLTKTMLWGRASMHVTFSYETSNCPVCGATLVRQCARCEREIFAPIVDRCRFCGLPPPWASERRSDTELASVQGWHPKDKDVHEPARFLYGHPERGDLWVIEGDIARLDVDAVVSNDDVDGRMWAQVSRSIKGAAGDDVERMAQAGKPFKLGEAWWTRAGALKMKGIVHVASMDRHGKSSVRTLGESLRKAFQVAEKQRCETLGVAAIGSGPLTIEPSAWFPAFTDIVVDYLCDASTVGGKGRLSIVLVLFEPPDYEAAVEALRLAVWKSWIELGDRRAGRPALEFERSRQGRFGRLLWLPKPGGTPLQEPGTELQELDGPAEDENENEDHRDVSAQRVADSDKPVSPSETTKNAKIVRTG